MSANEKQIGGDHYKKYGDLQPWDVVIQWNLGYLEGTALKYIARWRDKGGIADIKKAIHFLEKLVEVNSPKPEPIQLAQQMHHWELDHVIKTWQRERDARNAWEHHVSQSG